MTQGLTKRTFTSGSVGLRSRAPAPGGPGAPGTALSLLEHRGPSASGHLTPNSPNKPIVAAARTAVFLELCGASIGSRVLPVDL